MNMLSKEEIHKLFMDDEFNDRLDRALYNFETKKESLLTQFLKWFGMHK